MTDPAHPWLWIAYLCRRARLESRADYLEARMGYWVWRRWIGCPIPEAQP